VSADNFETEQNRHSGDHGRLSDALVAGVPEAGDSRTAEAPEEERAGNQRRVTIRYRLACLVLACVLPVWLAVGLLVSYNYQDKRATVESHMLDTARALSLVVDRELASIQATLAALSTSPSLASGDFAAFHSQARAVLEQYPGADIILADANGQQLVNSFVPIGVPLPKRSVPDTVRRLHQTGKPSITNLFRGAVTGRPLISVDVPVFRNGRVVYDLALTTPTDHFGIVLSQQHLPSQWVGTIIDGNHVVVARTRLSEELVGRQVGPGLLQHLARAPEGTAELRNLENIPVFDSFSRSAVSGWAVVIAVPQALVRAEIWQWLRWVVLGAALLSIVGVVLALLMGQSITRSIQALIAPALALGRGEPIALGHFDLRETHEVGESLARASQLLRQRAAEREHAESVRRRAEELQRFNAELERSDTEARAHAAELNKIVEILRSNEARLRVALDAANSGTWEWDLHRNEYTWSEEVWRLYGLDPQDGNPSYEKWSAAIYSQDRDLVQRAMKDAGRQGVEVDLEHRVPLPDGSFRWLTLRGRPICDANGCPLRFVGIVMDTTERKQAEQALIRSEKLASAGRMAATVAHEINNPLAAVTYAVYLANADPSLSPQAKSSLQIAAQELERATELTKRTLGFYRERTTPSFFDLPELVDSVLNLFSPKLQSAGIAVVKRYGHVGPIPGVGGEIRQVVTNLLSNSVDALVNHGKIYLRVVPFTKARSRFARLTIADTGTGIPPERLTKVFEPFFTTKETVGTGLGLWVTKELVQKHGGVIRVRSKPGRGTVFCVILPGSENNADEAGARPSANTPNRRAMGTPTEPDSA
jgi:PAS domain S-box-containing protein